LAAEPVHADVKFVDFNLPDAGDGCAQVVLQRVGRKPQEEIDEAVVSDFRQERLFVRLGKSGNDLGRRIGNLDSDQVRIGSDPAFSGKMERILGSTGAFDDPLASFRLGGEDARWQGTRYRKA
jgi:hypothetical protein